MVVGVSRSGGSGVFTSPAKACCAVAVSGDTFFYDGDSCRMFACVSGAIVCSYT